MGVRRVVTGHSPDGKGVFVSDELVAAFPIGDAGSAALMLWARDDVARFPDDGQPSSVTAQFPPPGGCALAIMEMAPDDDAQFHEFVRTSQAPWSDPGDRGMLRRATLDFDVVLQGTVALELDDGAEITLQAGDVLVQNGTRHRWHNRGSTTARVMTFSVGAQHAFQHGLVP
jgi:mannose-6-phosphate isomerase-like protein (cupin superfamily)